MIYWPLVIYTGLGPRASVSVNPCNEIWGTYLPKLDKKLGIVEGVNLEYFDAEYIGKVALRFSKLGS